MPPSVYTSARIFSSVRCSDVFAKEWVSVGRASSLAKPGDYLTYELAGQPIFVIRDARHGAAGHVERVPASHVDAARRHGQPTADRVPLSCLDL